MCHWLTGPPTLASQFYLHGSCCVPSICCLRVSKKLVWGLADSSESSNKPTLWFPQHTAKTDRMDCWTVSATSSLSTGSLHGKTFPNMPAELARTLQTAVWQLCQLFLTHTFKPLLWTQLQVSCTLNVLHSELLDIKTYFLSFYAVLINAAFTPGTWRAFFECAFSQQSSHWTVNTRTQY